jgi:OPT family oligopeptide transporter
MNFDDPEAIEAIGEEEQLSLTAIGQMTEEEWYEKVYQGDRVPQLTVRAVLMGGILGSLMSISNLYTSIKVGWSFGVAITACVLSYVIWNSVRTLFPRLTNMSILENNCMQSTASAAGYSTGATVGTAFGALLLITGVHMDWRIMLSWTLVTAALGVFIAVPMKRQMVNRERLPFPSGIAAAETLRSLYGRSRESVIQAYALVSALGVGAIVGFLKNGEFPWQTKLGLKLTDLVQFPARFQGVDMTRVPGFGFEPSVLLIGAGMIVGIRVSASMLVGSLLLYCVIGPAMINLPGEIAEPAKLLKWSLWPGTALMVTSGLMAFALQWKTIARSFTSIKIDKTDESDKAKDRVSNIEVPISWLVAGIVPLSIIMVALQYFAFQINIVLGLFAVLMSFALALVACRSTGETDVTPIGAMGKLTQLAYAALAKASTTTNLMTGSVTANIASSSADLLTDLKSGYLLGANPRQQFIAQFIGLFFGTLSVVPAWYLMIPDKATLEHYNPPSANMWRAVAEALTKGISYVPEHARVGMVIAALIGIVLAVLDHYAPKHWKPYIPSAMGLGLAWVVPFQNALAFFLGAMITVVWTKMRQKSAELFVVPIASGAIAGESLMCAVLAMYNAAMALATKH